jgi:nitrogen PTS system EIIA component
MQGGIMKLSSLLNTELIFFDVEGKDRKTVYTDIVTKMSENKIKFDCTCEELVTRIIERENVTSIPYEKSFAFPHMRLPDLKDLHIAVGILRKPVKLKPNDISKTQIVILFLISNCTSQVYLMTLAAFTKFLIQNGNSEKLIRSGTSEEFVNVLDGNTIEIKHSITAEDIMQADYPHIMENDRITKALDLFASEKKLVLPVIDKNNKLIGKIDAYDLMKRSIPKYMLMLDNSQFLTSFEPFENIINDENSVHVKDYISDPEMIISPETPLIQVTLLFVKRLKKILFVVKDGNLLGVVTMQEIINKVLRG